MLPFTGHLPMIESSHGTYRTLGACVIVGLGVAVLHRRSVIVAIEDHHPAHGPTDDVGPLIMGEGTGLSEGRDGGQDNIGLDLREIGITHPEAVHVSRRITLDHNVGGFDKGLEQLPSLFLLDVQGYSPFAGIIGKPEETLFRILDVSVKGSLTPRRTSPRRFYLDHINAEIPEHLAADEIAVIC